MHINVKGGTRAGWRKIRGAVTSAGRKDWVCPGCDSLIRYYWLKCPHCGHPREDA